MKAGQAILSFYQHGDHLDRYLALRSGVVGLPRLERRVLEPLLIKTRDELEYGEPRATLLPRLSTRLYRQLLGPAEARLVGIRSLLVLPDGLVRYVPFHALVDRDRHGRRRFLVEQLDLSYAPCLALARPRLPPPAHAAVFAPRYSSDPSHLAGALAEARTTAARYGGVRVRRGVDASPVRFIRALGSPGFLVHFAGHGLDGLSPDSTPELLFPGSQDTIGPRMLTKAPVRAPLVVLAACATGYAARFRDDRQLVAPVTLVEALLAAGARSVIAASWVVKDGQSRHQLNTFYDRVDRAGPAAALNQAQRVAMGRIRPPHPRFWAFYAHHGAW